MNSTTCLVERVTAHDDVIDRLNPGPSINHCPLLSGTCTMHFNEALDDFCPHLQ